MPNEIKIPFHSEFEAPMLNGKKTAITRTKRYGYPSDCFEAFGRVFILTEVYPSFLDVIVTAHYIEEGFNSPLEFIEFWDRIHPNVIYLQRPGRSVYFHRFAIKGVMAKFAQFNRKDLTSIQIQERAQRRREMRKMRGLLTPKGTQPRWPVTGEPVYKPILLKSPSLLDLTPLSALLPWVIMRHMREARQRREDGK